MGHTAVGCGLTPGHAAAAVMVGGVFVVAQVVVGQAEEARRRGWLDDWRRQI